LQIRWRFGSFLQGWRVFCKRAEDATVRALEKLRVARARACSAQSRVEKLEDALSRSQADAKALEERTRALQKVSHSFGRGSNLLVCKASFDRCEGSVHLQADAKALEERSRALQKVGQRFWELHFFVCKASL
jgi:hypothetical protein